jgi:tetratricopeptide (TPR) repeat protein
MTKSLFPEYIQRKDIQNYIKTNIEKVQCDGESRAFLLYGKGGRGKTFLQRNLPDVFKDRDDIMWLDPIDLDDIQFWSLINFKIYLADVLDKESKECFKSYRELLGDYWKYARYEKRRQDERDIGLREYRRQLEKEFIKAYRHFLKESGKIIVIQLDTIEAVRDFDICADLIDWLKRLPKTLLLISGRPSTIEKDRLINGLERSPSFPYVKKELGIFSEQESRNYLEQSAVFNGLEKNEIEKIILFVKGHPLWLALTVYYLEQVGLPQTLVRYPLETLENLSKDHSIFNEYVSELLTPYKERTFWHEAILRLSILRQRMNFQIWKTIMEDISLPEEVENWDNAWEIFKTLPWVRERANKRYITLQDAFAEELAKHYVPKVDKVGNLRHSLWQVAEETYDELINSRKIGLANPKDHEMLLVSENMKDARNFFDSESPYLELYLLQTAELHYKMLADVENGSQFFISLSKEALGKSRRQLVDLLSLEIQRFLPGQSLGALNDVEHSRLGEIQDWLESHSETFFNVLDALFELRLSLGRPGQIKKYLVQRVDEWKEQNKQDVYIDSLIWLFTSTWREHPKKGRGYLYDALEVAKKAKQNDSIREYLPKLYQLMGFSYRADQQLKEASDWLEKAVKASREQHNPAILASALNLLAYIYATMGYTGKAGAMIRQALEIRQRLLDRESEGTPTRRSKNIDLAWSYNTLAEINRYRGKLAAAQTFYRKAERIFHQERDYEGQATSLQALSDTRRRIALAAYRRGDVEQSLKYWRDSKESIEESLSIFSRYVLTAIIIVTSVSKGHTCHNWRYVLACTFTS